MVPSAHRYTKARREIPPSLVNTNPISFMVISLCRLPRRRIWRRLPRILFDPAGLRARSAVGGLFCPTWHPRRPGWLTLYIYKIINAGILSRSFFTFFIFFFAQCRKSLWRQDLRHETFFANSIYSSFL